MAIAYVLYDCVRMMQEFKHVSGVVCDNEEYEISAIQL